jgi:hypothetical protein
LRGLGSHASQLDRSLDVDHLDILQN